MQLLELRRISPFKPLKSFRHTRGYERERKLNRRDINKHKAQLNKDADMIKRFWTEEEIKILKRDYPIKSTKEIAQRISRTESQVYNKVFALGLKKTEEYLKQMLQDTYSKLEESGKISRFSKGHTPHNKGKKWDEVISKEAQEKMRKTTFKKGNIPHNAYQAGEIIIRQRKDKSEKPYKWIKLEGKIRLVELHRHMWEKENGKIPKGYNVVFKDGNTMNCQLSNLELISNAELMSKNTIHNYPPEVKEVIQLVGKLNKTIQRCQEQH